LQFFCSHFVFYLAFLIFLSFLTPLSSAFCTNLTLRKECGFSSLYSRTACQQISHISEVYCSKAHLALTVHSFKYFLPFTLPQNPDVTFISHSFLFHSLFKTIVFCFCIPLGVACSAKLFLSYPINVLQLVNVPFCACRFRQMSANSRGVIVRF
jgi:hypothetical protein